MLSVLAKIRSSRSMSFLSASRTHSGQPASSSSTQCGSIVPRMPIPTVLEAHVAIVGQFAVVFAPSSSENSTPISWYDCEICRLRRALGGPASTAVLLRW